MHKGLLRLAASVGACAALALGGSSSAIALTSSIATSSDTAGQSHVSDPNASQLRTEVRNGTLAQQHGEVGCANPAQGPALRCDYQIVTSSQGSSTPLRSSTPYGYGANDLERAYNLTGAPSRTGTIAIVDAGADPSLESDLGVYRAQYGLPPCTTANGCFSQEKYTGGRPFQPISPNSFGGFGPIIEYEIAVETSLDVDMASAACPACHITEIQVPLRDGLLISQRQVEKSARDFSEATQLAHQQGDSSVSISYGLPTDREMDQGQPAQNMSVPGTAVYGSTGDDGYNGRFQTWPAALDTVIAAGGTSLYQQGSGFAQTGWSDAGSGCTPELPAANGQPAAVAAYCNGHRAAADLSSEADPFTGVAVYDSYNPVPEEEPTLGWIVVGGTSVSSPFLAGMNSRAGVQPTVNGPNVLYGQPASKINDITLGSNDYPGSCQADGYDVAVCQSGPGWDGLTGLGAPLGLQTFTTP